jgi:hypothetical protein
VPVLHVQRARPHVGEKARPVVQGDEDDGGQRAEQQRDQRRGQDPPHPSRPERGQRQRPAAVGLAHEHPGDQEAGDGEEDVDADEAARQRARPQVVDDHEQDGDGAQRLDLGPDAGAHGGVAPRER